MILLKLRNLSIFSIYHIQDVRIGSEMWKRTNHSRRLKQVQEKVLQVSGLSQSVGHWGEGY